MNSADCGAFDSPHLLLALSPSVFTRGGLFGLSSAYQSALISFTCQRNRIEKNTSEASHAYRVQTSSLHFAVLNV